MVQRMGVKAGSVAGDMKCVTSANLLVHCRRKLTCELGGPLTLFGVQQITLSLCTRDL